MREGRGTPPPDGAVQRSNAVGLDRGDAPSPAKRPPVGRDLRASPSETERTGKPPVARGPSPQARECAETGIGRIERIVSERKMPTRAAESFRTQMALRLAASGADRAVVKAWLDRTAPAKPAQRIAVSSSAAEPEKSQFDMSALTPEEREVIGMNANFIHATTR